VNWDMPLLLGSFLAILFSLVWSRATIVGPILFAWAGAAAGGTVAFVRHFDKVNDRVDIEHIVPSAAVGAACGLLPGFAVRAAYLRGGRRRQAALEAFAAAALFAGLGMVRGWNFHRFGDHPISGASRWAAACAVVGAGLALVNWIGRPADAGAGAAPDRGGIRRP